MEEGAHGVKTQRKVLPAQRRATTSKGDPEPGGLHFPEAHLRHLGERSFEVLLQVPPHGVELETDRLEPCCTRGAGPRAQRSGTQTAEDGPSTQQAHTIKTALSFLFPVEQALFHDLVDEEDVRQQRPQVDGRVQVVYELGADRGLGQRQPQTGARLFDVLLQNVDEGLEALFRVELLAFDAPAKEIGEAGHRFVALRKQPPDLASALRALVAVEPLSGVGEHELVALFDGIDAFLQVFQRHGRMGENKNPLSTWEGWRGANEFTESSLPRSPPSDPGRGGRDSPSW